MITFSSCAKFNKTTTLLLVSREQLAKKKFDFSDDAIKATILDLNRGSIFSAEETEIYPIHIQGKQVILVGLGELAKTSFTSLCRTVRKALFCPYLKKAETIEIIPDVRQDILVRATIEAILIGGYVWEKYVEKSKKDKKAPVNKKHYTIIAEGKREYQDLIKMCEGVTLTRDLINENADVANSDYIEKVIRKIVKGHRDIHIELLKGKEMKAKGLNLFLAVNKGSRNEPKLMILKYSGANKKEPYTAFVGKGITFDTGGINLKPSGYLETMRMDMSGAATVIGLLANVLSLGIRKNIIFAVALAENAIDANAYKPGDVIKGYSGKSVEIGNTDAEGRLVLADAMAYLVKNYRPFHIIDIATLTGACIVALGYDYTGLMCNDDKLADALMASAHRTDDRLWRLPLYKELEQHIKSKIADIKNIGLPKGAAGTISAAEFLRQFVENSKWAHLDIAGTAFVDGDERLYYGHGATGAGVRLLTDYLSTN